MQFWCSQFVLSHCWALVDGGHALDPYACVLPLACRWYDTTLTRFVRDEPARNEMCNLLGMLSLSAKPGNAGIPVGHVVQYKVGKARGVHRRGWSIWCLLQRVAGLQAQGGNHPRCPGPGLSTGKLREKSRGGRGRRQDGGMHWECT